MGARGELHFWRKAAMQTKKKITERAERREERGI
jgi:hypothetical protein